MHMKAVTEGARKAALGIIMWSNQSRCWCNRWLAANGEGKLQPYLNEWRQRRKDTAYLVSESLHWATAPPVGQGLDSIGKDGFELVRSRLSFLFFFPQIILLFLLSFCLVIVQCLLCCFCFLCVPLFTVCTLERNLWLSDWLIQNSSNFEWYFRCV